MSLPADKNPRIAIVGNMNNAGFAIMRYFRDLGADAFLLPYSTDGTGNLAHFAPEADSWSIERWRPYIRALNIPNVSAAALGQLAGFRAAPGRKEIAAAFEGYDRFVGSGVAPALFERIGRRLDIFFPYGTGIEFYGDIEFRARNASSFLLRRLAYGRLRKMQASGIRRARHCLNAEMSVTRVSFEKIGKPFERWALPAVYNLENSAGVEPPAGLREAVARIRSADFSIFCCSRLLWVRAPRLSDQEWRSFSKNSDWLFRGFARFLRANPDARPLLAVVEYGPDVEASKKLVAELGIERHVLWLPKMPRREIMLLLKMSDIGVGEFYVDPGVIWGGTGWEVLAAGRPLLQSFNFTQEGFESEFGQPAPPILDAKSPAELANQLTAMYLSPELRRSISQASLDWFNQYNGIGLARQWLELLQREARQ